MYLSYFFLIHRSSIDFPRLKEGGLDHVLFGRNEQGNQHFHQWIDKVLNSDTDKDLNSLFSNTSDNK